MQDASVDELQEQSPGRYSGAPMGMIADLRRLHEPREQHERASFSRRLALGKSPGRRSESRLRGLALSGGGVRAAALVITLLTLLVIADFVLVSAAASWLALLLTLVQLPLIACVGVLHARRCAALSSATGRLEEIGSHAEKVEAALSRDEETLHEVRATIVGLSLAVHLLAEAHDDLPAATRTRLETLHASELERLQRLLTDAPREESRWVALDDVVDPFVDSIRARGQQVLWEGTGCRVWGRRDEIAEIVHVLLENAARHAPESEVRVEVTAGPDRIELRVADRGPGVPPELASTLFERGVRGAGSPGQGLGLHVARRLSREMRGDLCLERSSAQVGAVFSLTLPAERTGRGEAG